MKNLPAESSDFFSRLFLLYFSFFKIASLVLGGGLAMLPVIEDTFVNRKGLLTKDELLDMVTLTQTVPGIIAVNSATYVGMKAAGLAGAFCAVLGVITPSFVIIVLIAAYLPNLNPQNPIVLSCFSTVKSCITGLIMATAYKTLKNTVKDSVCVMLILFYLTMLLFGVLKPMYVIVCAILLGIVIHGLKVRFKWAALEKL